MNHDHVEQWMVKTYGATARQYRLSDEVDATGKDHNHIGSILSGISASFGRPIAVLDAGCGTGRYFHCLQNVERLVGMDVSSEMLAEARRPVRGEEVSIRQIDLICDSFYKASFPAESFDLIYCIGVFGNGCALTKELSQKFHQWLRPSGRLFFDSLDISGLSFKDRVRKRVRDRLYAVLPPQLQQVWDQRSGWVPLFAASRRELGSMLRTCGFVDVQLESRNCHLPLGVGRKLQCLAVKGD